MTFIMWGLLGSRLPGIGDLHNVGCRLSGIVVQCPKSCSGVRPLSVSFFIEKEPHKQLRMKRKRKGER